MSTVARDSGGGDFTPVAQGSYPAVCDQVVDLGVQPGGQFKPQQKIYLRFQVPSERVEWQDKDSRKQEGPMVIGRTFTLSLSEKSNLRPFLESWRGKAFTGQELSGFDIKNVLGVPCLIQVIHEKGRDSKIFAKVQTAMSLPKGMAKPAVEGDLLYFDADNPNDDVFAKLSKRTQKRIQERLMPADQADEHSNADGDPGFGSDDDIPF